MRKDSKRIIDLLDFIKIDASNIICYFRCKVTNKLVTSSVPFEPYSGKIKITIQDMILHPLKSYQRYYHTPIVVFGGKHQETIVLKAFKKVSNSFTWNEEENKYIYN